MSSAVNDLNDEKSNEENATNTVLQKVEEKPNLMTFIPKSEDNYLETLRNFGITVKCVPKRGANHTQPVLPKVEENTDAPILPKVEENNDAVEQPADDPVDIKQLLSNSSISIVKKAKTLPISSPVSSKSADEEDPIAKLSSFGASVSIARKTSTESASSSCETPLESNTESTTVKPVEKVDRVSVNPIEKSDSVSLKPVAKSSGIKRTRRPKQILPIVENDLLTEIKTEPGLEEEYTEPAKGNEQIPIRTRVNSNTSQTSTISSKTRRNSNTSLASSEHLEENPIENFPKEQIPLKTPTKRGGRRGRGRGRGIRRVASGRISRRSNLYEKDLSFYLPVKTVSVTKRQTRGKKISVSNYSESEDSDFERYINENTESPIDYFKETTNLEEKGKGDEHTSTEEPHAFQIENTESLSDLLKETASTEEQDDHNSSAEVAEESHPFRKSDIEIPSQFVETTEKEQTVTEEKPSDESEVVLDKPQEEILSQEDNESNLPAASSKFSITILQNEDYNEVLKNTRNDYSELAEEEISQGLTETVPSEDGGESCNLSVSRSVTPAQSTGYLSDSSKTDEIPSKKRRFTSTSSTPVPERYPSDDLFCWYCKRNFSKKTLFWKHISSHIRLPYVYLTKVTPDEIEHHCGPGYRYIPSNKMSSLKLTLKSNNNHEFEIINKETLTADQTMNSEYADEEFESNLEDGMELEDTTHHDDALENDNMELDDPIDSNINLADSEHILTAPNEESNILGEETFEESSETNEQYTENEDSSNFANDAIRKGEENEEETSEKTSDENTETSQPTYIPGVRIRSLESVQRLENGTPESSHSQSSSSSPSLAQGSSPTLRVRTNLTSPQNNMSHIQNQLAAPNMYGQQQDPYAQNTHGYGSQNPFMNPQQMGGHPQNMYSSQQSMTYNNNGYASYSSYNQTTYVGNGNYSPNPASYWSNGQGTEAVDPLAINPEDDPLKISQSGEKEQETNGNLLKTFLDQPNTNVNPGLGNDNPAMAEFMPLDRLISSTTCQVCSERFPDIQSLEEHRHRLNHYSGPNPNIPSQHAPSTALQPLGTTALQTLANAHGQLGAPGMQPIQHQIRVQHNVIVNNVIQQQPMAPIPPYGQPQAMVDNSMQQLAQQVNRMPPPSSQYGPYGPSQPPPPYGGQSPYRMPALPPPPGQPAAYNQNNNGHYGSQYGQYPSNQPIALPAPPSSSTNPQTHPSQQYGQRPPQQPRGPNAPGVPNVRPRGQAYLPTTQVGPPLAPPPPGMRVPVRGTYRPPALRGRSGPPMAAQRMQGPPPPRGPPQSMNQATRMRRPMPNQSQQNTDPIKRKRLDVLLPDRHDDADCHVIAVQQRNDDLPVIQNIQGNVTEAADPLSKVKDSMIHLTDSITLSVRGKENNGASTQQQPSNSPPSAASAVADILATRGITVTPAAKSNVANQSKSNDRSADNNPVAQVAINLNNAVSIIPAQKTNSVERPARPPSTVDLTDEEQAKMDSSLARPNKPYKCSICPKQFNSQDLYTLHVGKHRTLPFRCDRCPAAYPKQGDLINHRKNCRANNSPSNSSSASNLGLPVVDLRRPQVLQSLSRLGIHHYIPLAQGNDNGCFGLPVVSVDGARNPNIVNLSALGSNNLLPLGPVQQIPIPNNNRPH